MVFVGQYFWNSNHVKIYGCFETHSMATFFAEQQKDRLLPDAVILMYDDEDGSYEYVTLGDGLDFLSAVYYDAEKDKDVFLQFAVGRIELESMIDDEIIKFRRKV